MHINTKAKQSYTEYPLYSVSFPLKWLNETLVMRRDHGETHWLTCGTYWWSMVVARNNYYNTNKVIMCNNKNKIVNSSIHINMQQKLLCIYDMFPSLLQCWSWIKGQRVGKGRTDTCLAPCGTVLYSQVHLVGIPRRPLHHVAAKQFRGQVTRGATQLWDATTYGSYTHASSLTLSHSFQNTIIYDFNVLIKVQQ